MTESNDLADARASVEAARLSVEGLVASIDRDSRRRTNRLLAFVVVIVLAFSAFVFVRWRQSIADCHRANESRAQIRDITKDAGEALIDVFPGAPTDRVNQYRSNLEAVVNQLPDREC